MDSRLPNSKDFRSTHSNHQNNVYEENNNDIVYDEISNFGFTEVDSNYQNQYNTQKIELSLDNQKIQNQSIENSLETLLSTEQAMQLSNPISEDHEDTSLLCIENHTHIATNMNLDDLYQVNLNTILNEMIINDSLDATNILEDLNYVDNTEIRIISRKKSLCAPSRPSPQQKLKRAAHIQNPLYINNSLNKSLFNEGPETKRIKTPLNSPISISHQSLANTSTPSPLKSHDQSPLETLTPSLPIMPQPLDTYAISFLPIPHEFQFNHINESILQTNAFPFLSSTNKNEDVINIKNVFPNLENLEKINGNKDLGIADSSLDTPIIGGYSISNDIYTKDEILQFDIPNMSSNNQNIEFIDICNNTIANDMFLKFEIPNEFPTSIENLDLSNIFDIIDDNSKNLNKECRNTSHTITQQTRAKDMNAKSNFDKNPNIMALKGIDNNNTNYEVSSQVSNEPSTSCNTKDANVNNFYILKKEKNSLMLAGLTNNEKITVETNILQEESLLEMMIDAIEEPIDELIEIQEEPLSWSAYNDVEISKLEQVEKSNAPQHKITRGAYLIREGFWEAQLPILGTKNKTWRIGVYSTSERAARVRDLVALKLKFLEKIPNFKLNFPISNYIDDIEEMKKWSDDDFIWSFKRQSLLFSPSKSGLRWVYPVKQKNPYNAEMWKGRITLRKGNKAIEGSKTEIIVGIDSAKEILGIFTDLVNLYLSGWDYVTNFRPGHYAIDDVQKFISLLEGKKVHEAYEWDLIKQVLKEPLPSNRYLRNSPKVEKHSRENFVANLNPKDMAKHFIECPWIELEESWALYKKPINDYDLEFEDTIIRKYAASNWSPTDIKSNSIECEKEKEYKFYFPCVIATNFAEINIQRRILGLDFLQYLFNIPHTDTIEHHQKQWVNLPNIRYLDLDFYNVISCDGGLLVVKAHENEQNFSNQDKNISTIIITNPLTYDIKILPPIPYKVLQPTTARLVFYDSTRTTYRLIVMGSYCKETMFDDDKKIIVSKQISLVVYCSIKQDWVHFENVLNAAPPFKRLGHSSIVVQGYSVYYGGIQISSQKKGLPKPVIFYFNTKNSRRQQLTIDFSKAGDMFFMKDVEPPKLVQIGLNTKIYAVSRQARFKQNPDVLFIIEVVVNEDGTPTGSYKVLTQGVMPKILYKLLFKHDNNIGGKIKMTPDVSSPWEVIASVGHIAIKVIGFDPLIVLYNVKDEKWNYTCFPYTEPVCKLPNTKAWRLIPGVYEPRWNAIP